MDKLKLYNTLSGKKEEFKPIEDKKVGLYTCGPTVYNFAHIGNLRTFIFEDILRRTLEYNDYEVKHVMNITDVGHLTSNEDTGEDKIEKAAAEQKKSAWEIAEFYTKEFKKDIIDLNIEPAHILPKATEHIKEQIELIKILEEKGFTYKTSDGIYFDTSKFKVYGKLGNIDIRGLEEGARIEKNKEKKNLTDFALWKFSPDPPAGGKKRQMEWDSPWGIGFPGWHIECSAMAVKYLGQPFDIHTGGIDHIPVHHQNEIAQSEAAHGKPLVNYWMHGEFLVISPVRNSASNRVKMGKSEGNLITLNTIKEKGFNPLAYRFLVLGAHYKTPLNFSWEAMETAKNGLEHLYNQLSVISRQPSDSKKIDKKFKEKFLKAINDDLNAPKALAVIQDLLKSKLIADSCKLTTLLDFDRVLGLKLKEALEPIKAPQEVIDLAEKREQMRKDKNWAESDALREKIQELGFDIEDTDKGYTIKKK